MENEQSNFLTNYFSIQGINKTAYIADDWINIIFDPTISTNQKISSVQLGLQYFLTWLKHLCIAANSNYLSIEHINAIKESVLTNLLVLADILNDLAKIVYFDTSCIDSRREFLHVYVKDAIVTIKKIIGKSEFILSFY